MSTHLFPSLYRTGLFQWVLMRLWNRKNQTRFQLQLPFIGCWNKVLALRAIRNNIIRFRKWHRIGRLVNFAIHLATSVVLGPVSVVTIAIPTTADVMLIVSRCSGIFFSLVQKANYRHFPFGDTIRVFCSISPLVSLRWNERRCSGCLQLPVVKETQRERQN